MSLARSAALAQSAMTALGQATGLVYGKDVLGFDTTGAMAKAKDAAAWVQRLRDDLRVEDRLAARHEASPEECSAAMLRRERKQFGALRDANPRQQAGVHYLRSIDAETQHREYTVQEAASQEDAA